MLDLDQAYWVLAAFLLLAGLINLRERRWRAGAFWIVLALLFAGGNGVLHARAAGVHWPSELAGAGVLLLACLAPAVGRSPPAQADPVQRDASARRLGHRLFIPALLIPLVTIAVTLGGGYLHTAGRPWFDPAHLTLVGFALSCLCAALAAVWIGRQPAATALTEGRRLLDTLGWAALLPLVLASLGAVLTASGVGNAIAHVTEAMIPVHSRLACVLAYALGMVVFTVIMGNAFAAFPVLTAGIGLPLLVHMHGANPAVVGSLGMLSGYCGTLLTPMAANFNIVPVALLELDDNWAVIRAQLPTALVLLVFNILAMYLLVFR